MSFRGPQGPNGLVGHSLGHYRIIEQIGAGGMGVVYRAHDEQLERDVAVKVLPLGTLADEAARKRFRREALALAKLNHPNIATIFEFGTHNGTDYLVTEYISGQTLDEKLAAGALAEMEVVGLGIQLAQGLSAAHEHGIVHRDLKPANLRVTPDGRLKILDFGLAQLMPHASDGLTATLTQSQEVAGTLPYMAPEQLRGGVADARTDIWAAGAVLYEVATAHRPFEEKVPTALAGDIIHKVPAPPRKVRSELSAKLEAVILKCLEKEPSNRYSSARELQSDLERLITGVTPLAARRGLWPVIAASAIVVVILAVGTFFYLRRSPKLTEKDTIVLADFSNRTGDAIFDETLKQALAIDLGQSPFLNIFPEDSVRETLRYMGHSPNEQVTTAIAREICERRGIKAMLTGSISSLGRNYAIALEARNCRTAESLAQQQVEVQGKEQVLRGLDKAASKLRAQLGESLGSIQKFDAPLDQATTNSLEALQAYSLAQQQRARGADEDVAIPFLKRAIELDPNFAMAYATLGTVYAQTIGPLKIDLSIEYLKKAFELRDRVSEREKLYLSAHYYQGVTHELDKTIETYELWKQTYPRDAMPYTNLSVMYASIGKYGEAAENAREAIRLRPDHIFAYEHLAEAYVGLNQLREAKAICDKAIAEKLDGSEMRWLMYKIAFMENDTAAMQRQLEWAKSKGEGTRVPFFQALAAAYWGKLQQSRELFRQVIEGERAGHDEEGASSVTMQQALIDAQFGFTRRAKDQAVVTAGAIPQSDKDLAALTLALVGEADRAQALVNALEKRSPQDTLLNDVLAPSVRAAIEINRNNANRAIELLRPTIPYELGTDARFLPIYLRGQAYLRTRAGKEAATEFQKILDHRGVAPLSPLHALAHLQLACAWALQGDTGKSRAAYQDFLTLWKDADPDIPILKDAKAEYAKLQ
jgi:serine/threonine protein kinase/tetratricopeptide (TPR) repeat protein